MERVINNHQLHISNLQRQFQDISSNFDQAEEISKISHLALDESVMNDYTT